MEAKKNFISFIKRKAKLASVLLMQNSYNLYMKSPQKYKKANYKYSTKTPHCLSHQFR